MSSVNVRIPEALLKRAQATTGQRRAETAVRYALEIATHDYKLSAAGRRGLEQSIREERAGKGRRFKTARAAIRYLEKAAGI